MASMFVTFPTVEHGQYMLPSYPTVKGVPFNTNHDFPVHDNLIVPNVLSPKNAKPKINDNKKVEVRWLETEAELYIKQWRRRYRQLEGGFDQRFSFSNWLQNNHDRFCEHELFLTSYALLDIDPSLLTDCTDIDKFNLENYTQAFDLIFSRGTGKAAFVFNRYDEDDGELMLQPIVSNEFTMMPFDAIIPIDVANLQFNQELLQALKQNKLVLKNGKLEKENSHRHQPKEKTHTEMKKRKKNQKSSYTSSTPTLPSIIPLQSQSKETLVATVTGNPIINSVTPITPIGSTIMYNNIDPLNSQNISPVTAMLPAAKPTKTRGTKKRSRTNDLNEMENATINTSSSNSACKPRIRPPTTRRQMYICEYPGCSYQSDRNFNFLRHKRTHGKQKNNNGDDSNSGTKNLSASTNTTVAAPISHLLSTTQPFF